MVSTQRKTLEPREILWEQSLLAIAVGQFGRCWLCRRLREQARSHSGLLAFTIPWNDAKSCGSKACSRSRLVSLGGVGCTDAFPSKPAPTVDRWRSRYLGTTRNPVGAKLTRDRGERKSTRLNSLH